MHLINAGQASYPEAWSGYNACCSYDRRTWFRVPTSYDESTGKLTIQHTPEYSSVFYSFFAPYTYDAHMDLVAQSQLSPMVRLEMLGETVDGHDMDLLILGEDDPEKKKIWLIARQHPGESMAEWFVQGALGRLLDRCATAAVDM
jgi:murein tripeptide amidase MpaA